MERLDLTCEVHTLQHRATFKVKRTITRFADFCISLIRPNLLDDVEQLGNALLDLHDECENWEDVQLQTYLSPVLANAREALRDAGYEIVRS